MEVEFRVSHSLSERRSKVVSKTSRNNRSSHTENSINIFAKAIRAIAMCLFSGNKEFKVVSTPLIRDTHFIFPGVSWKFDRAISTLSDFTSFSTLASRSYGVINVSLALRVFSAVLSFNNKPVRSCVVYNVERAWLSLTSSNCNRSMVSQGVSHQLFHFMWDLSWECSSSLIVFCLIAVVESHGFNPFNTLFKVMLWSSSSFVSFTFHWSPSSIDVVLKKLLLVAFTINELI